MIDAPSSRKIILTERMHELLVACLIDATEDASLPMQEDVRKLLNIVRAAKRMDGAHA